MSLAINTLLSNVGMTADAIVIWIAVCGMAILLAKDFKLGLLLNTFIFGGIFVWFYQVGLDWTLPLICLVMCLIILAMTLVSVNKSNTSTGFI